MLFESEQISLFFPCKNQVLDLRHHPEKLIYTHLRRRGGDKQNNENICFCQSYLAKKEAEKDQSQNTLYPVLAG